MNIVFLDTYSLGDADLSPISTLGNYTGYEFTRSTQTVERCAEADIIITNKVLLNREVLIQLPRTKLVCIAATGTNNIDLEAAKELGIEVRNASDYSTQSVAQATFAMTLSMLHNTSMYDSYVKEGEYATSGRFTFHGQPYFEISGKQWGIIGLGNIGRRVAEIASAFGARVAYYSSSGNDRSSQYLRLTLDELLATSDIVSIHSPLTPETTNLIAYKELCTMQPHALLVNMARGGIVEETDLTRALNENRLAGACLDVFAQEPLRADSPLLTQLHNPRKLLCAPHIAWASAEARKKLVGIIAGHITRFIG